MDIEKAFEEFIEKEWHDGHEPQGIDDQYVEEVLDGEEVELNEKLVPKIKFKHKSQYLKKMNLKQPECQWKHQLYLMRKELHILQP